MNVLKEDVKDFVKDLMVVRTHVDPANLEGVSKPWLTCTIVEKDDLPWNVADESDDDDRGLNTVARQAMQIEETGIEADDEDES